MWEGGKRVPELPRGEFQSLGKSGYEVGPGGANNVSRNRSRTWRGSSRRVRTQRYRACLKRLLLIMVPPPWYIADPEGQIHFVTDAVALSDLANKRGVKKRGENLLRRLVDPSNEKVQIDRLCAIHPSTRACSMRVQMVCQSILCCQLLASRPHLLTFLLYCLRRNDGTSCRHSTSCRCTSSIGHCWKG